MRTQESLTLTLTLALFLILAAPHLAATPAPSQPDCSASIDLTQRVDTTLVRRVDVDGDGQLDDVKLHVQGERFDRPFTRELTVASKERVLLRINDQDQWLDSLFADRDFTGGCSGYARCKCKWYFEQILAGTVQNTSRLGKGVFDPAAGNSIHHIARKYLIEHCNATAEGAQQAVRNAITRIQTGGAFIVVPQISPAQARMPLFWFPEVSCFAPIYED